MRPYECVDCKDIKNENLISFNNYLPKEIIKNINSFSICKKCCKLNKIEQDYNEMLSNLTNIKITPNSKYIKIAYAMKKYIDERDIENTGFYYVYAKQNMSNIWWQYALLHNKMIKLYLNIIKINNRYYCSYERLKAINFKVIYDYNLRYINSN